jgi:ribosomal 50S subunit-recycling heat shock protein
MASKEVKVANIIKIVLDNLNALPFNVSVLKENISPQNASQMVCEMASKDSDWSVSLPSPNWTDIRMTEVVTCLPRKQA